MENKLEGKMKYQLDRIIIWILSLLTIILLSNSTFSLISYCFFSFILFSELQGRELNSYALLTDKTLYTREYYFFGLICIKKKKELNKEEYQSFYNSLKKSGNFLIYKEDGKTVRFKSAIQ